MLFRRASFQTGTRQNAHIHIFSSILVQKWGWDRVGVGLGWVGVGLGFGLGWVI